MERENFKNLEEERRGGQEAGESGFGLSAGDLSGELIRNNPYRGKQEQEHPESQPELSIDDGDLLR